MPLRPLFTSLLLVASLTAHAATEVVPLQHRSSAELLPALQAFIGKDGTVSAFENKLIVNASPERIDDLRALLQQLDTAPKRLLISVDNNDSNFQDNRGNARVIHYGTSNRDGGMQQVQASEGQPALIDPGGPEHPHYQHQHRRLWAHSKQHRIPQRDPRLLRNPEPERRNGSSANKQQ